ncbi:pentapeptide repeat-containing protein [Agrilutibacter solisilvae]|uniref:Pentapeptide repeat-containing protein n=1 Tax=Agrilutibacter solisilvae TaxID=2763317 RepID=A0A975ARK2_9GAMM|nr:pentapeptide repeat-containing protein [Lysobacter solisilvae]QSX77974.1 pentapeptide repeat-containing protein [Lysobacter solisilvae]
MLNNESDHFSILRVEMSLFSVKFTELRIVGWTIAGYAVLLIAVTVLFDRSGGFLTYSLGLYGEADFWVGFITEAHGFLLDLVIIAFVLSWVTKSLERKHAITRFQEEIDDFRPWRTPESAFRIAGCVKRLANERVREIDLYECFLKQADLRGLDLTGAKLWGADLGDAVLKNCVLTDAKMKGCYLVAARCSGARFERAFMKNSRCMFGEFSGCSFRTATLVRVSFSGANLRGADLSGADVTGASFQDADLAGVDFRDVAGLLVEQLLKAKSVRGAQLPPNIAQQFAADHPERVKVHVHSDGRRFTTLK